MRTSIDDDSESKAQHPRKAHQTSVTRAGQKRHDKVDKLLNSQLFTAYSLKPSKLSVNRSIIVGSSLFKDFNDIQNERRTQAHRQLLL